MENTPKPISVRMLTHNFAKIATQTKRGQSYVVMNRLKPVCFITPPTSPQKSMTLEELFALASKAPKNKKNNKLSEQVDEIVYKV